MRQRMVRRMKTAVMMSGGFVVVLGGTCIPDNLWIDNSGEIINRAIFGLINAALAAAETGIAI